MGANNHECGNLDVDEDYIENISNLSHQEMIGHVVSAADVVRLPIHIHTWLLSEHISIRMIMMMITMITITMKFDDDRGLYDDHMRLAYTQVTIGKR